MRRLYRYAIDIWNNPYYVSGWCFHRLFTRRPVTLTFVADDRLIGTVIADNYRKDLQAKQLHPSGRCGFDFNFPGDIRITEYQQLVIYAGTAKTPLVRLATKDLPQIQRKTLPKIFFMHIPKSAGTSFNALCRLYYPHERMKIHIESLDLARSQDLFAQYDYLAGHLPLHRIRQHFGNDGYELYSIVRNPYRHLHSHLNWVRSVGVNPAGGFFAKHNPTIQGLALKLNRTDFADKQQLRALVSSFSSFELDFFDNCQTRYFLDYRPERVSQTDLDNALTNLQQFSAIGLTEEYDGFVDDFCRRFELQRIPQPAAFNRAIHAALFDPADQEVQKILAPLVCFDLQLYREIKARKL